MLKSVMADAKKGDSFMRQNRIKKFLAAGLSGLLILSLTGCGQAAKLPETVVNTSLVVEKDGKVTSYLVNTFDKEFYNLDGLTQMVEEEAEEFNAAHTEVTENPLTVKTVQALEGGSMVQWYRSSPIRTAMPSTTNRSCSMEPEWKHWPRGSAWIWDW